MNKEIRDKEIVIESCINALRQFNNDGLNQFVSENGLSIPEELSDEVDKMLDSLKLLAREAEDASFIDKFFEESEEKFCSCISNYINNRIRTFKELSFIYELTEEEFNNLFEHALKNYVLERNELESYSNFTEEQIKIAIKVVNTSIRLIIDELFSKKSFFMYALDIFEFSENNCSKLWEMINDNKNELRYISIIRKLRK